MRIRAIRGRNLASLGSVFAVDFDAEPLASAGLFAITGPTGAGKSTLLDALCVALYEKTPRLARAGGKGEVPDVGDAAVTPGDPRTLLRRGAAEGHAEVDYTGIDGASYRARWSVRRARGKPDGKLQQTEIALMRLENGEAGEVLGDHRKTETLKAIEATIGLNFEQFTRAVLLAQNDFAAFLKASDDERAELLQTLTGTATFSRISIQAFARMKAEKDALEQMQRQFQELAPLTPEERQAREAEALALAARQQGLAQRRALLDGQLQWFARDAQLQQQGAEHARRRDAAATAVHAATPRAQLLARIDAVQDARQLHADALRCAQAAEAMVAAQRQSASEHDAALRAAREIQAREEQARQALALAEKQRADAQPMLDAAHALDARLDTLAPLRDAASAALKHAQQNLAQAGARRTLAQQQLTAAETQRDEARAWLGRNAGQRMLAEAWPRWEAYLGQAEKIEAERRALSGEHARRGATLQDLAAQAAAAAQAVVARQAEFEAARQGLATAAQALGAFDAEALVRRKAALETLREQLMHAAHGWQALTERVQQRQTLAQRRAGEHEAGAQAERRLSAAKQALPQAAQALAGATEAHELAQRIASETATHLRATLRDGAPCPVCGADEHPYATGAPQVDAMLGGLREAVEQKQQAHDRIYREQVDAEARVRQAAEQLRRLDDELETVDAQVRTQRAQADAAWRAVTVTMAGGAVMGAVIEGAVGAEAGADIEADIEAVRLAPGPEAAPLEQAPPESERADWLAARQEAVRVALLTLGQEDAAFRDALRRRDALQKETDALAPALAEAQAAQRRFEQALQGLRQEQDAAQKRVAALAEALEAQLALFDAASPEPGWRERWRAAPAEFAGACARVVADWLAQQQRAVDAEARLAQLKLVLDAAREAVDAATRQVAERQQACDLQEQAWREAAAMRRELFDGEPAAVAAKKFDDALSAARDAGMQAQRAAQQAQAAQIRAAETLRHAGQQAARAQAEQERARDALQHWIDAFNARPLPEHAAGAVVEGEAKGEALTVAALATLLGHDAAWIATERGVLQQLAHDHAQAQAVLDAHLRICDAHTATRPAESTPESLRAALTQLDMEATQTADALAAARHALQRDAERLEQSARLRAQIECQAEKSRVWAQLGELIGSADGKKFRNFAQQLTLDVLLGYANRHLQDLSRRYRLERIGDSLGLLVVDRDMGDEIRSVHSLSGGESFLVSLALALALASLSSHRVRVESLFIDEGFGTLDADALAVAMEALDSLQAQGRKVGVISHVQDMNERIGTRIRVRRLAGGMSRVDVE